MRGFSGLALFDFLASGLPDDLYPFWVPGRLAALFVRFGGLAGLSEIFCAEAAVGLIIRSKNPSFVAPLTRDFGLESSAADLEAGGFELDLCVGGFEPDRCTGGFELDRCTGGLEVDLFTGVLASAVSFLRVDGFRPRPVFDAVPAGLASDFMETGGVEDEVFLTEAAVGAIREDGSFTGRVGDFALGLGPGGDVLSVAAEDGLEGFFSGLLEAAGFVAGFAAVFFGEVGVFGGIGDFAGPEGFNSSDDEDFGEDFGVVFSTDLSLSSLPLVVLSALGSASGVSSVTAMLPLRVFFTLMSLLTTGREPSRVSKVEGRLALGCTSGEFFAMGGLGRAGRAAAAPNCFSGPGSRDGVSIAASGMVSVTCWLSRLASNSSAIDSLRSRTAMGLRSSLILKLERRFEKDIPELLVSGVEGAGGLLLVLLVASAELSSASFRSADCALRSTATKLVRTFDRGRF